MHKSIPCNILASIRLPQFRRIVILRISLSSILVSSCIMVADSTNDQSLTRFFYHLSNNLYMYILESIKNPPKHSVAFSPFNKNPSLHSNRHESSKIFPFQDILSILMPMVMAVIKSVFMVTIVLTHIGVRGHMSHLYLIRNFTSMLSIRQVRQIAADQSNLELHGMS